MGQESCTAVGSLCGLKVSVVATVSSGDQVEPRVRAD